MATILNTLVGSPPDIRDTIAYTAWCDEAAAALRTYNDADFVGATTYYVDSASGSDSNAGTSEGAPWQTLTKLNLTTNVSGVAIKVKIKAGSIFQVATGIKAARPVYVSRYGAGNNPILTRCVQTLAGSSGSWVSDTGTTYYCPNSAFSSIAVGIMVTKAYSAVYSDEPWAAYPWTMAASISECRSTSYSYFYDTGMSRLYVNFGSLTKNSLSLWLSNNASTADYAIELATGSGGCIVEGIDIVGWEEKATIDVSNSTNGIWLNDGTADDTVKVIRNCRFRAGGRHHVTWAVGSTGDNQCLAIFDSKFGTYSHYNESQIVFDPADDAKPTADLFVSNCVSDGGFLPSPFTGAQTKANGVFVGRHGDVDANAGGMIITHRCRTSAAADPLTYAWCQIARPNAAQNNHIPAASWTSTTWDYRQVNVACDYRMPWKGSFLDIGNYEAWVACQLEAWPSAGNYSSTYGNAFAAFLSCDMTFDLRSQSLEWGMIHLASATPSTRILGSTIRLRNTAGLASSQRCGIFYESAVATYTAAQMAAALFQLHDTAIVADGSLGAATKIAATNNAGHVRNLALGENILAIGSTTSAAADHGNITDKFAVPDVGTSMLLAGAGGGTRLTGDVFGQVRPTAASVGALELAPVTGANADVLEVLSSGVTVSGNTVDADVINDARVWFAEGRRARNIVELNAGFTGTLALVPDLNPGVTISSVDAVEFTGETDIVASSFTVDRSRKRAHFVVPELSDTGTFDLSVTITAIDGDTIVTTGTLKVY